MDVEALGAQHADERLADPIVVLDQQHGGARSGERGVAGCAMWCAICGLHHLHIGTSTW
jgi:hypothetical protein